MTFLGNSYGYGGYGYITATNSTNQAHPSVDIASYQGILILSLPYFHLNRFKYIHKVGILAVPLLLLIICLFLESASYQNYNSHGGNGMHTGTGLPRNSFCKYSTVFVI